MRKRLLLAVTSMVLLAGCGAVRINRILDNPAKYQNRNVSVHGKVTNSYGALVAGVYQVDDGTGKIYVLSNRSVPSKGAEVKVSGSVTPGVSVMGRSFGTTIRERDRDIK